MDFPDCVGLKIDDARRLILTWNKEIKISISETHSFKDKEVMNIAESVVIRQINDEAEIDLVVAFF